MGGRPVLEMAFGRIQSPANGFNIHVAVQSVGSFLLQRIEFAILAASIHAASAPVVEKPATGESDQIGDCLHPGARILQSVDEVADDRLAFRARPYRFKGFIMQLVSLPNSRSNVIPAVLGKGQ